MLQYFSYNFILKTNEIVKSVYVRFYEVQQNWEFDTKFEIS